MDRDKVAQSGSYDPKYDRDNIRSQYNESPINQAGGYENLDIHIKKVEESIKYTEGHIESLKKDLENLNINLAEMKKVRKLVTPKDEARIQQLRNLGLV